MRRIKDRKKSGSEQWHYLRYVVLVAVPLAPERAMKHVRYRPALGFRSRASVWYLHLPAG